MEQWKPIPGYEGLYEASDMGRIRTSEGKTTRSARFEKRVWKQRIMKQKIQKRNAGNNYDFRVSLWKDGVEKTLLVSRLIAKTWCDGFKEGLTVNHIDGNALNNNPENLEWVTLGENIRHAYETGLIPQTHCTLIDASGERITFRSLSQASKHIGRCTGYISSRLSKGYKCAVASNGSVYQIIT